MVDNCVWKSEPKPCQFWLIFQNSVALPFCLFYVQERTKLPSKCNSGWTVSPTKSLPCGSNPVPPISLFPVSVNLTAAFTSGDASSSSKQHLNPLGCFSKTWIKNQLITSHDIDFSTSGGQAAEVGLPAQESLLQAHRQCH